MQAVICFQDTESAQRFSALPEQLGLSDVLGSNNIPSDCSHVFWAGPGGLSFGVYNHDAHQPAATGIDLADSGFLHRLRTSGKAGGLGKALGLQKYPGLYVLDATAGLGRDAALMAHMGCRVTMLERSPLIHALLSDALDRALDCGTPEVLSLLPQLQLFASEAREWMQDCQSGKREQPDVIYLDPMFPGRTKSARVKKDMALLQEVLGVETDFSSLLEVARKTARMRVVVKRPGNKQDPDLPAPSHIITGKTAHFEVYVNSSFSMTR